MKKNIFIIGFPNYSLINFYGNLLLENKDEYNFYIITNTVDDDEQRRKFDNFKAQQIIKDFFFIEIDKVTNFNLLSTLRSFNYIKKILKKFQDIIIHKIVCSDFSHIEVKYLISNLKKTNPNLQLIGFNHHSFKIPKKGVNINSFRIRDLFKIRTNLRLFKIYYLHFIKNIFLSILYFKRTNQNFFIQIYYPLFHKNINYIISDKPFEITQYKKKFKNIKIFSIKYDDKNLSPVKYHKSLLVLLDLIKNEEGNKFLVNEYEKYIKILVEKLKLNKVFLKPHPRDFTNNPDAIKKTLINFNLTIIPKNINVSKIICEHEYILGAGSSVMSNAINSCTNTYVFGMLNLGNKICRDPNVKTLLGDAYGFKSGIVWIEEYDNFQKLSSQEVLKLSIDQKKDRTLSKEKSILLSNFFKDQDNVKFY